MMRIFILLITTFILSGCYEDTPKCNSNDAKNLVIDISRKEIEKMLKLDADVSISVNNVRTINHDSKLDVYQCAADLTFVKPDVKQDIPITYRIQQTDEGNGQFYINVFGL
jgi:PBP1b-binding outer membrane lipoprotein LpoB